jgi:hypothetical protein
MNGKTIVLHSKGKYSLLVRAKENKGGSFQIEPLGYTPYIVAFMLEKSLTEKGIHTWGHGHYFCSLEEAFECFREKTTEVQEEETEIRAIFCGNDNDSIDTDLSDRETREMIEYIVDKGKPNKDVSVTIEEKEIDEGMNEKYFRRVHIISSFPDVLVKVIHKGDVCEIPFHTFHTHGYHEISRQEFLQNNDNLEIRVIDQTRSDIEKRKVR